ncbi:hypothetical protein N7504_001566 [Penicillium tannophilum]|nr:hypothetical protein N7504_001566 [Penicillium tannophilum]
MEDLLVGLAADLLEEPIKSILREPVEQIVIGYRDVIIIGDTAVWLEGVINGKSDTEILQDTLEAGLEKLSNQIQAVQKTVDRIERQGNRILLTMKLDQIKDIINNIDDTYKSVVWFLGEISRISKLSIPADEKAKQLSPFQSELTERLRPAKALPKDLRRMHEFLSDKSEEGLPSQMAKQALEQSNDFLSYYCNMKSQMVYYWMIQGKAMALLRLAHNSPDINFLDGPHRIQEVVDNLKEQQKIFKSKLGEKTELGEKIADLADAFLKAPSGQVTVQMMRHNKKEWAHVENDSIIRFSQSPDLWHIQLLTSIDNDTTHQFRIVHAPTNMFIAHNPDGEWTGGLFSDVARIERCFMKPTESDPRYPTTWRLKAQPEGSLALVMGSGKNDQIMLYDYIEITLANNQLKN